MRMQAVDGLWWPREGAKAAVPTLRDLAQRDPDSTTRSSARAALQDRRFIGSSGRGNATRGVTVVPSAWIGEPATERGC